MTTATIKTHRVNCQGEDGPTHYDALSLTTGKPVATITGPGTVETDARGIGWWVLDGNHYALRDALAFARRGERGFAVVVVV